VILGALVLAAVVQGTPVTRRREGDVFLRVLAPSSEKAFNRLASTASMVMQSLAADAAPGDVPLTDWNGLMIAALAQGAEVLDDASYAVAARRAAAVFLTPHLHHSNKQRAVFLDDYPFLTWAC